MEASDEQRLVVAGGPTPAVSQPGASAGSSMHPSYGHPCPKVREGHPCPGPTACDLPTYGRALRQTRPVPARCGSPPRYWSPALSGFVTERERGRQLAMALRHAETEAELQPVASVFDARHLERRLVPASLMQLAAQN